MENNENLGVETPNNVQSEIDYKAEYEKMLAERDSYKAEYEKNKGLKDKYASENAEYKKKEQARLSDEEKNALELETLRKQVASFTLEKTLLEQGYTAQEISKLMADNCSPKAYAEIMNDRIKAQEKTLKAEAINTSTANANLNNALNGEDNKLSYAERLAKSQFDDNSANIKNLYKK